MSKMIDHNGLLQNDQNNFAGKFLQFQGYKMLDTTPHGTINRPYKTHL